MLWMVKSSAIVESHPEEFISTAVSKLDEVYICPFAAHVKVSQTDVSILLEVGAPTIKFNVIFESQPAAEGIMVKYCPVVVYVWLFASQR